MNTEIVCIYHKDCIDGSASAAVVLKKFPHAQMFPLAHGYLPEEIEVIFDCISPKAQVYIVDSTLGHQEFILRGHNVTILDHHVSEYERVTEFAKEHAHCTYIFDNKKSGASLAWSYFFPDVPVPKLIQHVEDKDIWLLKYGELTEHVTNYLSIFRNDPVRVVDWIDEDIEKIYERGKTLTAYVHTEVGKSILLEPLTLAIGKYTVPAYNIGTHQSICGNTLSTENGSAVALYTISGNSVKLSFRSNQHQIPSALDCAQVFGGGGHERAAGACITLKEFLKGIEQE